MPCFCQFFNKAKQYRAVSSAPKSDGASNTDQTDPIRGGSAVSASELVQLKAEVWTLRNALSDATAVNNNMQDAITQAVAEKYELLDELQRAKSEIATLETERRKERNLYCQEKDKFLQEIASYRVKINELSFLVDKISQQNIDLKQSLFEANDTVCKIGHKYMKLKSSGY
ncbi:uncharacterized protein LOC110675326 [Aedes aegypti]|uniref:Uncharacterized protein n=1 Tax=Aedes aegypti TaxID=7159 RepID=A0A6I8TY62_AEDAE|nr:uncharacterized protein LOC110675326 [Aedes aegypti]